MAKGPGTGRAEDHAEENNNARQPMLHARVHELAGHRSHLHKVGHRKSSCRKSRDLEHKMSAKMPDTASNQYVTFKILLLMS